MTIQSRKLAIIIDLHGRGYDFDFFVEDNIVHCLQNSRTIDIDELVVQDAFLVKNDSIIYAVSLINEDLKGILSTPYCRLNQGISITVWFKLANGIKNCPFFKQPLSLV